MPCYEKRQQRCSLALSGQATSLSRFTGTDVDKVWDGMDIDERRAVINTLLELTLHSPDAAHGSSTLTPSDTTEEPTCPDGGEDRAPGWAGVMPVTSNEEGSALSVPEEPAVPSRLRMIAAGSALLAATVGLPALASRPQQASASHQRWTSYERPATYGVIVDKDVPVTMRDGTILSVDVHRPDKPGRYPIVLSITPYGKSGTSDDYLTQRGYAYVVADVRGTGGSQGTWQSFAADEQHDGYDMVEWAARQRWSTGKVGMYGPSYLAITQLFTAEQQPPHLKALFPLVPAADTYRDISNSGGGYNTGFMPSWELGLVGGVSMVPPTYAADDPVRALGVMGQHATNPAQFQVPAIAGPLTGGAAAYDGPAYRLRSPIEHIDRVKVPTFILGGEHDIFQRGEPLLYEALRKNGVTAKFINGDWGHLKGSDGSGLPAAGLPVSLPSLTLRWFDHYLRGVDTHIDQIPNVTNWTLGKGSFEVQPNWPLPGIQAQKLYLAPGKALTAKPTRGAGDTTPITFTNGACSRSLNQWTALGGADGTPCDTENRQNEQDALVYTTSALKKDLKVSGPIGARLWVSTTAKDVALTVRVTDVAPDGTSTERTSGWLVASLRKTDPKRARLLNGDVIQPRQYYTRDAVLPVVAGKPMLMDVEVWNTNAVFIKGHYVRVSITTSDAPHLTQAAQIASEAGGTLTILRDRAHPSRLVLPVAP